MMSEEQKASDLEFITVDAAEAGVPAASVKVPAAKGSKAEDGQALYVRLRGSGHLFCIRKLWCV